jgi:RHS repeat-associated protein
MTKTLRALVLLLALGIGFVPSASRPQGVGGPPVMPGQTATQLPDGRWLLLGGQGTAGPQLAAILWDPRTQLGSPLARPLLQAREWHSATLEPDGSILIVGGVGSNGQLIPEAERFVPGTQTFEALSNTGLVPRASHTATLMTDGRILIAGGVGSQGQALADAQIWDTSSQKAEPASVALTTARRSATATLLPDGTILLWGGLDAQGVPVTTGDVFDPAASSVTNVTQLPGSAQVSSVPPQLTASVPTAGAADIPLDSVFALRFSKPLQAESLNGVTVTLSGPFGLVSALVVPAEGGRLAFITPQASLQPGITYSLTLNGVVDTSGFLLPFTGINFTTMAAMASGPSSASQSGSPARSSTSPGTEQSAQPRFTTGDDMVWRGEMRDGKPYSRWQGLPPLQAPPGVTALAGQVLQLNGEPLPDVTLQIEGVLTRTDQTGRFLLANIPAGHQEMLIDARSASRPGRAYGVFEVGVDPVPGKTTALPYTSWQPRLDTAHEVIIPSPTQSDVVITTPGIQGLELHLPAGSVIKDHEGKVSYKVGITPIPVDRPPFPLATNIIVPVYYTIQPGAGYVENPSRTKARLVYPNYHNAPPGAWENFWVYDPSPVGWKIYGTGTVTANGRQVAPKPGVGIYEFTGAMIGGTPPNCDPTTQLCPVVGGPRDTDPVDLGTGLFVMDRTDLTIQDLLPIVLTRTYQPADPNMRPFGIGMTHPYEMFLWSAQLYTQADLMLPDGSRIHYVRISPGTGFTDAVFENQDGPTRFYKSQIAWANPGWNVTLKDGTVYVIGENAPLQAIRDRYGNTVTLTRGPNPTLGAIQRLTSPNGRWIAFTYDAQNRITQTQDNIGRTATYTYDRPGDPPGRLWKVTDPAGGVTEYTYDATGRMTTIKDARGIVFLTNEYDANGRIFRQTQADSTTYQLTYTLDGNGKVTQTDVTNPRGFVRRVTFNSSGYTLTDTRALGQPEAQQTTYVRDPGTQFISSMTDALARQSAYTYDPKGNLLTVMRPGPSGNVTWTYTYEPTFNQVQTIKDPLNHTTTFGFDGSGNLTTITNPRGKITTLTYDAQGRPLTVKDPLNHTWTYTYDGADLATVKNPLNQTTTRYSDSAGRLVSLKDPLGNQTRYTWDGLSRLSQITDALSGLTQFGYDPNGNLLSVTDARGNQTTYTPDAMDRVQTRTDALLHAEGSTYDQNGNLKTFTDRKGQQRTKTYDALDRLTRVDYADSSFTTYTWDAGNRLTQLVDSITGTITRTPDILDRLQQEVTAQGTVSYGYDNANRRTSMIVLGQPQVTYGYDTADRLTSITQGTASVTIGYDDANRRTTLTFPNTVQATYGYDTSNRLTSITFKKGSTTLGTLTYAYDAAGRRTVLGGTWARTGLPAAVASASYNTNNQQTAWGGQTNTFDLNGNLTSDGSSTYTWDARDRLYGISGAASASFEYDPAGRRVSKTIAGTTTQFLYDGANPVQELSGAGAVLANLLTGLGIDEYFTRTDGSGRRTLLADALGSILSLADDAGTVQTSYTYEPFGGTAVTGQANGNSFQYTGRENDQTGAYFYRARHYSPAASRFLAEDPARLNGGASDSYTYVFNTPINGRDPSGLAGTFCFAFTMPVAPGTGLAGRNPIVQVHLLRVGGGQGGHPDLPPNLDPTCDQNCYAGAQRQVQDEWSRLGYESFGCGLVAAVACVVTKNPYFCGALVLVCSVHAFYKAEELSKKQLKLYEDCKATKCGR